MAFGWKRTACQASTAWSSLVFSRIAVLEFRSPFDDLAILHGFSFYSFRWHRCLLFLISCDVYALDFSGPLALHPLSNRHSVSTPKVLFSAFAGSRRLSEKLEKHKKRGKNASAATLAGPRQYERLSTHCVMDSALDNSGFTDTIRQSDALCLGAAVTTITNSWNLTFCLFTHDFGSYSIHFFSDSFIFFFLFSLLGITSGGDYP